MGNLKQALDAYQAFLHEKRDVHPKVKKQAEQYVAFCQMALQPAPVAAPGEQLAKKEPPAGAVQALPVAAPPPPGAVQPLPGAVAAAPVQPLPEATPPLPPLPTAADAKPSAAIALPTLPEEDLTPPVLTHDPLRKAPAGSALKIVARIVDERSAVGDAQACWRNLFHIEYDCVPLTGGANDEYSAVVPASAVADGFAYYLEAFDALGNGPTRSGTPELPHSVAVQEAETPLQKAIAYSPNELRHYVAQRLLRGLNPPSRN